MGAAVEIRSLAKSFGDFKALDDINLDIAAGEFLTLLGPSGSGKTTLLQAIAGFVRPSSGSIRVGGEELLLKPPHKRNIGMVFQSYALFPHMNVARNVAYPLRVRGVGKAEVEERVLKALATVQLEHLKDRAVTKLSGGQRQRVALARAIVFEPDILLMDEPLSALDKKLREQMQIEIRRLHDRLGTTTILVTHDQREALSISDRVAVINGGKLMQVGTPIEVYDRPRTKFVADFIGETAFVQLEIDAGGAPRIWGEALRTSTALELVAGARPWLMFRPEKLILAKGDHQRMNLFEATVRELIFQGDSLLLNATLKDGTEVAVRLPNQGEHALAPPRPGQSIRLGLHCDDAVVVADD
jgi:putative spermidine/putrescine transport system ATP-binding protein